MFVFFFPLVPAIKLRTLHLQGLEGAGLGAGRPAKGLLGVVGEEQEAASGQTLEEPSGPDMGHDRQPWSWMPRACDQRVESLVLRGGTLRLVLICLEVSRAVSSERCLLDVQVRMGRGSQDTVHPVHLWVLHLSIYQRMRIFRENYICTECVQTCFLVPEQQTVTTIYMIFTRY